MILFLLISLMHVAPASLKNPETMKLEFETLFKFDSFENTNHTKFMSFMQSVIEALYKSITEPVTDQREEIFAYFLYDLGHILQKYDTEDLKFVINAIDDNYKGYEKENHNDNPLLYNPNLRLYIKNTLKDWMQNDHMIKLKINDLIDKRNTTMDTEFFSLLTEMFSAEDLAHFQGFLKSFNNFPRNRNKYQLYGAIKDLLDYSLVHKYEKLDPAKKAKLRNSISKCFKAQKKRQIHRIDSSGSSEKDSKDKDSGPDSEKDSKGTDSKPVSEKDSKDADKRSDCDDSKNTDTDCGPDSKNDSRDKDNGSDCEKDSKGKDKSDDISDLESLKVTQARDGHRYVPSKSVVTKLGNSKKFSIVKTLGNKIANNIKTQGNKITNKANPGFY